MKKIKKIAIWSSLVLYLLVVSGFVSGLRNTVLIQHVNVFVSDSATKRFVMKNDIIKLLEKNELLSLGMPIGDVNTDLIEKTVMTNSLIKQCSVYTTIDGKLNIDLNQREPVVRIIDKLNQSYYLDSDGTIISMSRRFTPLLLVVNGNVPTPFSVYSVENIYNEKYDKRATCLRDIHKLALYIHDNELWNAQIEQIYVNKKGDFEMVPRVGPHLILFGSTEGMEEKFDKLLIFYKEGLKNVGWNQYQKINLKYKDQIVCTKI